MLIYEAKLKVMLSKEVCLFNASLRERRPASVIPGQLWKIRLYLKYEIDYLIKPRLRLFKGLRVGRTWLILSKVRSVNFLHLWMMRTLKRTIVYERNSRERLSKEVKVLRTLLILFNDSSVISMPLLIEKRRYYYY